MERKTGGDKMTPEQIESEQNKSDLYTLYFALIGRDPDRFAPETMEVMERIADRAWDHFKKDCRWEPAKQNHST